MVGALSGAVLGCTSFRPNSRVSRLGVVLLARTRYIRASDSLAP